MENAAPQDGDQLVTPTGLVYAETTTAADVILWGDVVAVRAMRLLRDAAIRPGWQHSAA